MTQNDLFRSVGRRSECKRVSISLLLLSPPLPDNAGPVCAGCPSAVSVSVSWTWIESVRIASLDGLPCYRTRVAIPCTGLQGHSSRIGPRLSRAVKPVAPDYCSRARPCYIRIVQSTLASQMRFTPSSWETPVRRLPGKQARPVDTWANRVCDALVEPLVRIEARRSRYENGRFLYCYVYKSRASSTYPHRRLGSPYPGDRLEAVSDGAHKAPHRAGRQVRLGPSEHGHEHEHEHASGGDGMELCVVVGSSHSPPLGVRLGLTGSRLE
jgi:hypothetical protein